VLLLGRLKGFIRPYNSHDEYTQQPLMRIKFEKLGERLGLGEVKKLARD
jgi:hypothetical protein